ncbi:MAG TPA: class I SAM-dependent methyltransferase family protein [Methanosarcinales archaeon]|nr:class I SAM-dependent methyltransferase family protein [Methanosarcinales archaeon]
MAIRNERFRCVRVARSDGERVRRALAEAGALQRDAVIQRDADHLYLPIKHGISIEESFPDLRAGIEYREFERRVEPSFEEILGFTPSYEVIGDIAIIDAEDSDEAGRIADAILLMHGNVSTIIAALTDVHGEFRVRDFRVIAGKPDTETVHKEYGCRYEVDLARVYFTPRLATERKRIADQVREDDVVVDMFAGVGPFSILAAKSARYVIAIDKNPVAIEYLQKNARLNSVNNIKILCGDVRDVASDLRDAADHIIMNLPHSAHEFLDCALTIIKPGGIIHYYDIRPEEDLFEGAQETIARAADMRGMTTRLLDKRVVRSYSPHRYNVALDVEICPRS